MNSLHDIEFKYYDKRIKEFDKLLSQAQSQTLIDLIIKAKERTNKSLEILVQIHKETIVYLQAYDQKNKDRIPKIQEHLGLISKNIADLKNLMLTLEMRDSLIDYYKSHLEFLQSRIQLEADVSAQTFKTFTFAAKEFDRVLLQLIFKPATGAFHYETLIEILNYFATKLIPGLEELKVVANLPISVKRKQFTRSGDKILMYLEQYIDVLEKWQTLGNAYIKIILD